MPSPTSPDLQKNEESPIIIGNLNDSLLIETIKCESDTSKSKSYKAYTVPSFTKEIRSCDISWINCKKSFISETFSDIIKEVNTMKNWNFELSRWQCDIQHTRYFGVGDHYDWHQDILHSDNPKDDRKVSIVYCLTSRFDYVGCDLQIRYGKGNELTIKLDKGDFVVFKSDLWHRVTSLVSGERETLVGWYQ